MFKFTKFLIFFCFFAINANANFSDWQKISDNFNAGKIRILKSGFVDKNNNKKLIIGAEFKIAKDWSLYSKGSESVGLVPSILVNNKKQEIIWPKAIAKKEQFGDFSLEYNIYKKHVILPIIIDEISSKKSLEININYGICKDICVPINSAFKIEISDEIDYKSLKEIDKFLSDKNILALNKIDKIDKINSQQNQSDNEKSFSLVNILLIAFLGGLILNIMPCVLPVLGVKMISIINHSNTKISKIRFSFLSTIIGIIFSFLLFSAIAFFLAKTGEIFNWGTQFQNPYFLILLILILTFFVANMIGLFEISFNQFLANILNKKIEKNKNNIFLPNFLSGILAVLLATPCSAPFLGTAISFALTQKSAIIFLIFTFMGLGFSLPYIILLFFPKAVYLLPKSGSWMLSVKKIMAGFLMATIIWLIYILSHNIGFLSAIIIAVISVVIFAIFKLKSRLIRNLFFIILIILSFILPKLINNSLEVYKNSADMVWIEFDREKIAYYLSQNKVVVVDVTADWCLTCKFNKYRVLRQESVVNKLKQENIIAMRADITKENIEVMNYINSHNRFAIPFNIIYGPNAKNGILTKVVLNKKEFLQLIEKAEK